mgnify:CR=1 FL=1
MNEDTSSRRAEWYEEYHEPDVPISNFSQIVRGYNLRIAPLVPKVGDIHFGPDGTPVGVITDIGTDGRIGVSLSSDFKQIVHVQPKGHGKSLASAGTHSGGGGFDILAKVADEASLVIGNLKNALNKIGKAIAPLQSDYELVPPAETVKERALRLSKQPHSMAPKNGKNFDRRGRRFQ